MEATFPTTSGGLASATALLEKTLAGVTCKVAVRNRLMVALDEIASNIVRCSGAPDFKVEIDFPENPSSIRLSFSDAGVPFNPLTVADPDVDQPENLRKVGGLGLFLVRKLMDKVTYSHENGRNVLTISKLRD